MWLQRAVSESAKRLKPSRKAVDEPERCNELVRMPNPTLTPKPKPKLKMKLESTSTPSKVDTEEKTTKIRWDEEERRRLLQLLDEAEQHHHMTIRTRMFSL